MKPADLTAHFFLALAVIVILCKCSHLVARLARQPQVVGEIVVGVLLGPSLLGLLWPAAEHALFPAALRPVIYVGGQIGLIAMMFQAGRELRSHASAGLAGKAATISTAAIIGPLALGLGLTYAAHGHAPVFASGISLFVTAAFVGVALSVTAFPVLVRIVIERGLIGSRHGSLALACGAVDDMLAWLLLAGILSVRYGHSWLMVKAFGGLAIFVAVLVLLVRPALVKLLGRRDLPSSTLVPIVLAVLFLSAWYTEAIGLYAVLGAFAVGMVMPDSATTEQLTPISDSLTGIFVPLFFVYSGLNTRFNTFTDLRVLSFAIAAVLAAVIGKFGVCWVISRACGESMITAARIGSLMNARGLMQLIALNIGVEAGIVNPQLFTAIVLVALVTTLMTTPVLTWLDRLEVRTAAEHEPALEQLV